MDIKATEVGPLTAVMGGPAAFAAHYEPLPGEDHGALVFPEETAQTDIDAVQKKLDALRAGTLTAPTLAALIITYKADVVRRCTDDEAAAFDAALTAASVKLRLLWNSIQYIDHAAPEFQVLHDAILAALTKIMAADQAEVRTTTLLMPSTTNASVPAVVA